MLAQAALPNARGRRWNDQYGEGGSRRKEPLAYYT